MGTAGPHLGPLKSPTRAKSSSTWSSDSRGPITAPSARKGRGGNEKEFISRGSVDPLQWNSKKIINLIYKRKFSLVFKFF